jgi:hypothetical protein
LGGSLDAEISKHRYHVASHVRILLDQHISVNGDHISGHFTAHKDGTIHAHKIARLLSRLYKNVMVNLDAISALSCQCWSSQKC